VTSAKYFILVADVQCWRRDKEQYAGFSNKLIISWSKKGPF
jgi:hypothetical protein